MAGEEVFSNRAEDNKKILNFLFLNIKEYHFFNLSWVKEKNHYLLKYSDESVRGREY